MARSSGIVPFFIWIIVLGLIGAGGFYLAQMIQQSRYDRRNDLFISQTSDAGGEFDRKLHIQIANGITDEDLADKLRALGFTVSQASRIASYQLMVVPCTHKWSVVWQIDGASQVTAMQGSASNWCAW